jgi:glycerophosphoryl diester phosphodiesterase
MGNQMARNAYLSPAGTLVFAHRGLVGDGAPENTIQAFTNAIAAGATHLETDVQVTQDGVAVLFHDDDLKRVAGIASKVSDVTLSQLQRIEIDGQTIPTLVEALEALPSAKFNIDIKTEGAISPTVEALIGAKALDRVLVSSFSNQRRLSALKLIDEAGMSVASSADGAVLLRLLWATALNDFGSFLHNSRGICALQIPTRYFGLSLTSKRLIDFATRAGLQVHYWVVNDPLQMVRLVERGAAGIVTDRADIAVLALR